MDDPTLSEATVEVFESLVSYYGETYIVHLEITQEIESSGLSVDHYLFGGVDWKHYEPSRWHSQNHFYPSATAKDASLAIRASSGKTIRLTLLSSDLIYAFHFRAQGALPVISVDLASAIFGKGTHLSYLTITKKGDAWFTYSAHPRAQGYMRFRGTLQDCLSRFGLVEGSAPHPYQAEIGRWPEIYAVHSKKKRTFL